jgi:YVTN family beta-propeller protein
MFTVLPPWTPQADEVVATVATGYGTRTVAITPDGAFAYAVSPDGNSIVVIDLWRFAYVTAIPVGENPVAIAIDPGGKFAYVANHVDGTVSVIDVDRESPSQNQVVDVVSVGTGPRDLAVMPDGDRLVVVNSLSNDLSVVDTDPSSETYRAVVASVSTGSGTSTVAITPDGGHMYVGTDNGYLVISAIDYGVVASVATGSGTSTVAITPDGAFLVLVTTEGAVNIYDIQDGSLTQHQVVASIQTGSGTTTVAITPDGGFLYLIQGTGDLIFVAALSVNPGVGVIEDTAAVPPVKVEATIVDTLTAGEDPAGIAFDPSGSGTFVVTNAGDLSISVFGFMSTLAGQVEADCPQPHTPLAGATIDVFKRGSGDLVATLLSDSDGQFASGFQTGDYTVTIITPIGYTTDSEEVPVTLAVGDTALVSFELQCETTIPDPRKMSFWKHQVALAVSGKGNPEIDGSTLCGYLDLIEAHFNNNLLNQVVVYQPPPVGECMEKLRVAKNVMNLRGYRETVAFARQELLALLFNVASGNLHLAGQASADGATISMAITYVDGLIDDGITENDDLARDIAKDINKGKVVRAGTIPLDTPNIMYTGGRGKFGLAQNCPNPFRDWTIVQFSIPEPVHVWLGVYDVTGRLVRTLVDGQERPGSYRIFWDGSDNRGQQVASGLYFCKFEAGGFTKTRKMIFVR